MAAAEPAPDDPKDNFDPRFDFNKDNKHDAKEEEARAQAQKNHETMEKFGVLSPPPVK